ncbi:putative ORFan [Tupanvirus deep ocean]|uniref:ORFan n=2 Tax=Tupanvirus TaxID=2094720 RepID=A0AC62A787_9VIRU|nr:putative ORFan [Tupanvirus deep ocean]QKU33655.1 putative ORFan [Tupanvirus deep ocean]
MSEKISLAPQVNMYRVPYTPNKAVYSSAHKEECAQSSLTVGDCESECEDYLVPKNVCVPKCTYNTESIKNIFVESHATKKTEVSCITDSQSQTIALVDLLNLARKDISNRGDAKFKNIDEFIINIKNIAYHLRSMGDFHKIYLVTKSFKFDKKVSYNDVLRIIMWSFCNAVPEWRQKICLVLVNGINDKDKEADDRALFILYNEFSKTSTKHVVILSNDNFGSIKSHFMRKVTLNFYFAKSITDTWISSEIVSKHKGVYQQDRRCVRNIYTVFHPITWTTDQIVVS